MGNRRMQNESLCQAVVNVEFLSTQECLQVPKMNQHNFSSKYALMLKETCEMKCLEMLWRQCDLNGMHDFLGKNLLTIRPMKKIDHNIITIIIFPICRM